MTGNTAWDVFQVLIALVYIPCRAVLNLVPVVLAYGVCKMLWALLVRVGAARRP